MITGSVNAFREALIRLVVVGEAGEEQEVEAVVDTGYTGALSLPPALIKELNLPFVQRGSAELADGSISVFDIHDGVVLWGDRRQRVAVDSVETDPLLGMSLLYGFELTIEVIEGGSVSLRQLKES